MSKTIDEMTPNEIIQAVRARDTKIIRTLVNEGVVVRKIWTQKEVAELTGVTQGAVSRWIKKGVHAS